MSVWKKWVLESGFVIIAVLFIIGIVATYTIFLTPHSSSVAVRKPKVDPVYCIVGSCQDEWAFGPWKPAHKLVFANNKSVVVYQYPARRCRTVYQIVDIYKNKHYVRVGRFKKFVQKTYHVKQYAGKECQLKNGVKIGTFPFEGTVSDSDGGMGQYNDYQLTGYNGYVYPGNGNTTPTQWEIL